MKPAARFVGIFCGKYRREWRLIGDIHRWRNTNATGISESSGLPLSEAGANFQFRSDCFAGAVNGGRSCSTLMFLIAPCASRDTSKTTMPSAVVWKGKSTSAADRTLAGL